MARTSEKPFDRKFGLLTPTMTSPTVTEDEPIPNPPFVGSRVAKGIELDEVETDVAHRAARLYRFDKKKYGRLTKQGFIFEI